MNCDHGDETGLNDACEECLNEALAKEFEAGRKSGRTLAFQEVLNLMSERVGELFMARKEDEAKTLRDLHDSISKTAKEGK